MRCQLLMIMALLILCAKATAEENSNDLLKSSSTTSSSASENAPKELTLIEKVAKFEKGKTTYSDVVRELGQPVRLDNRDDGTKAATFGGATATPNAASYIPFVNIFAGKTTIKGSSAALLFDKTDVLIWKTATQY
jgi:hypothetical protein